MDRLKILLCSDAYYPHPGGVSEYMHYLALNLRRLNNEVTILAPRYPETYKDNGFTKRIGRCFLYKGNKATITITLHHRLPILVRDFIRHEGFDIVHTNGPIAWNLPYWAFHYSRAVNIATFHTAFAGLNLYRYAKVLFKHEFQKQMHGVIYPSWTAFKTTYPHLPTPFRIIPNGVDTERFSPDHAPLGNFTAGGPKILFLGRLDDRKGLDRLLAAYPLIKARLKDAILIVVGSGPKIDYYRSLIPEKLRASVYFEGRASREVLPRYYRTCDVYVSPALGGEVFGIVLIEAMASGKPVVASAIPGYSEVIKDGYNGMLFNPRDPSDICEKVLRVLEDKNLAQALGRQGRRFALKHSWPTIAQQVLDYYHDLIKKEKK
jgi:phosphatidylinositol alpha-mannosyltransferase